jgi:hypothetical protein
MVISGRKHIQWVTELQELKYYIGFKIREV